jgi:hypothetical protein
MQLRMLSTNVESMSEKIEKYKASEANAHVPSDNRKTNVKIQYMMPTSNRVIIYHLYLINNLISRKRCVFMGNTIK